MRVLLQGQLNTAYDMVPKTSRLTLGRKVDVESFCHVVASSDGMVYTPRPGCSKLD